MRKSELSKEEKNGCVWREKEGKYVAVDSEDEAHAAVNDKVSKDPDLLRLNKEGELVPKSYLSKEDEPGYVMNGEKLEKAANENQARSAVAQTVKDAVQANSATNQIASKVNSESSSTNDAATSQQNSTSSSGSKSGTSTNSQEISSTVVQALGDFLNQWRLNSKGELVRKSELTSEEKKGCVWSEKEQKYVALDSEDEARAAVNNKVSKDSDLLRQNSEGKLVPKSSLSSNEQNGYVLKNGKWVLASTPEEGQGAVNQVFSNNAEKAITSQAGQGTINGTTVTDNNQANSSTSRGSNETLSEKIEISFEKTFGNKPISFVKQMRLNEDLEPVLLESLKGSNGYKIDSSGKAVKVNSAEEGIYAVAVAIVADKSLLLNKQKVLVSKSSLKSTDTPNGCKLDSKWNCVKANTEKEAQEAVIAAVCKDADILFNREGKPVSRASLKGTDIENGCRYDSDKKEWVPVNTLEEGIYGAASDGVEKAASIISSLFSKTTKVLAEGAKVVSKGVETLSSILSAFKRTKKKIDAEQQTVLQDSANNLKVIRKAQEDVSGITQTVSSTTEAANQKVVARSKNVAVKDKKSLQNKISLAEERLADLDKRIDEAEKQKQTQISTLEGDKGEQVKKLEELKKKDTPEKAVKREKSIENTKKQYDQRIESTKKKQDQKIAKLKQQKEEQNKKIKLWKSQVSALETKYGV